MHILILGIKKDKKSKGRKGFQKNAYRTRGKLLEIPTNFGNENEWN